MLEGQTRPKREWDFKDQIWSQIEGGPVEKERRRGRGREEEKKEEGEPRQKGMETHIRRVLEEIQDGFLKKDMKLKEELNRK